MKYLLIIDDEDTPVTWLEGSEELLLDGVFKPRLLIDDSVPDEVIEEEINLLHIRHRLIKQIK